jgi:putative phage-type endonuclease
MEQLSNEWFEARKGRFTASTIHKLMTDSRDKNEVLSDGAKTYVYEKVAERLGGHKTFFENDATRWGNENESMAISMFEFASGLTVERCGFFATKNNAGGSPDGLISKDLIIEVKCPYESHTHIKYTDFKNVDDFKKHCKDYYWQVQMNMLVTDRKQCFFISYDPRINSNLKIWWMIIPRNESDIDKLKMKIKQANELFNNLINIHNAGTC